MAEIQSRALLRQVRDLVAENAGRASDRQLLEQFVARRDEAAFAALVRRHGPGVLSLCRALLRHQQDAEDVFQAAFLVLARKAASIRKPEALGSWLYGVAHRLARKAQVRSARRGALEVPAAAEAEAWAADDITLRELRLVLHEELSRLPEKYRTPLLLCYWEGKTQEEAADHLGWRKGTFKERLHRARDLLRPRLERRGLALPAGGVAALLAQSAVQAVVPAALADATVRAALLFAAGQTVAADAAPTATVLLAKGALKSMALRRFAVVALFVLIAGAVGTGGGLLALRAIGGAPSPDPPAQAAPAAALKPAAGGARRDGIKVTLASARAEYRVGEAVDLTLAIENNTRADFSYPQYRIQDLQGFEMSGPDGKALEPLLNPVEIQWANVAVIVPSGKAVTVRDPLRGVNLARGGTDRYLRHAYYPMEVAGTYRLRIKLGKASSNELTVKIVGKAAAGAMAESTAVRVNDIDFQAVVRARPQAPVFGGRHAVQLGLRLTNRGKREQRLNLFDTIKLVLETPDGKPLALTFGRKDSGVPVPAVLASGQGDTIDFPTSLEWQNGGALLDLHAFDPTGGVWRPPGLRPGKYRLRFIYENTKAQDQGLTFWVGKATTAPAEFEIIAAGPPPPTPEALEAELRQLRGTWAAVSWERSGKLLSPEDLKRSGLHGLKLTFASSSLTRELEGVKGTFRYRLDPTKTPKEIDMIGVADLLDVRVHGIYKVEGDKLWLCQGRAGLSGRITEFKTAPGSNTDLIVLKRQGAVGAEGEPIPWGKAVDGIACRLAVYPGYVIGQALMASIEVKNTSDRTRYLVPRLDPQAIEWLTVEVVGPNGSVRQTQYGRGYGLGEKSFEPIGPGEVRRFEVTDLRNYFRDLGDWRASPDGKAKAVPAGKYTLTFRFRSPKVPPRFAVSQTEVQGKQVTTWKNAAPEVVAAQWAGEATSSPVAFELRPLGKDDLVVHEWGVFTVFNDVKYANADRKAEWGSLPSFFYRQFPKERLRWVPAAWDKPVVYFYAKPEPLHVRVKVTFTEGVPVVWWPAVANPVDDGGFRTASTPKRSRPFRSLTWHAWVGERVPPHRGGGGLTGVMEFALPEGCWLRDARVPGASPLTVVGNIEGQPKRIFPGSKDRSETERFLYYDGLVPAPSYVRCEKVEAKAVVLRNRAPFDLGPLFVVDRRVKGAVGFAFVDGGATPFKAGTTMRVELKPVAAADWPAAGLKQVRQALTAAGLFNAEADALLKIWRQRLLEADGVTAFHILLAAEYDRMLPLSILPAPAARPVRVGIALHPHVEIEPDLAARLAELLRQLDDAKFERRDAASKALLEIGPLAIALLQAELQKGPPLERSRRIQAILERVDAAEWLNFPAAKKAEKDKAPR